MSINEIKREDHPAPMLMRQTIMLLDGEWLLDGSPIRVPFPPQSVSSGYSHHVHDHMLYERRFMLSGALSGSDAGHILLHFGAVDQVCDVWVDGTHVARHEGGYLAFTCDITDALSPSSSWHILRVQVKDTLSHHYPYGKQRRIPGGMWYTPVSGIWQSVWLEAVPKTYISSVRLTPDLSGFRISVDLDGDTDLSHGINDLRLAYSITLPGGVTYDTVLGSAKAAYRVSVDDIYSHLGISGSPRLWSPDDPYLYDLDISLVRRANDGDDTLDTVSSYVALRTISIEPDANGINRVCLNKKPIFLNGVLDQGYYPDGIFRPADMTEYDRDIMRMKELGFNLLRKHIKVEPERYYYAADRLGMLVMQDMVNSGPYEYFSETIIPNLTFKKRPDTFFTHIDRGRKDFFIAHCRDTVAQLYDHPCIIAYTIFNEGWGQFESDRLYGLMKEWDPTRLVDSTSGWFAQRKSDFDSEHIYFHNARLVAKERPLLLSECGGFGYPVDGHRYHPKKTMGYGSYAKDPAELTLMIRNMLLAMVVPAIAGGMCGYIYTQLSDVEEEINGLYTYDREVLKAEPEELKTMNRMLTDLLENAARHD